MEWKVVHMNWMYKLYRDEKVYKDIKSPKEKIGDFFLLSSCNNIFK